MVLIKNLLVHSYMLLETLNTLYCMKKTVIHLVPAHPVSLMH